MALAADLQIRAATAADAESIADVHFSAVHMLAAGWYSAQVLGTWSPTPSEARFRQFRQAINGGQETVYVAQLAGQAVAFGSLVPASRELRALYVHASASARGIGSALLVRLEAAAAELGCQQLHLSASLNSADFYRRHGYEAIEQARHRFENGCEMACVKMRKSLAPRCSAA
jgi:putative acetyltransferase